MTDVAPIGASKMNQKITKYDCINLCYNGLRAFYADYEIDVDSVINNPRFGFGGTKLTKGIEANRKAKGKVFTRIDDGFTHPKTGNEYPNFTASLNGGSMTGTFSCWDYLKDSSANNETFTARIAPKVAPVAKSTNDDDARKLAEFNALRDLLPTLELERGDFVYLTDKAITPIISKEATGLRRGKNKHGEYIAYPLTQTIGGEICCIQTIGANGFKIIRNAYEGAKIGAFYVLGGIKNAHKGIQFVEGLASGLSAKHATGLVTVICLDAGNLPVVVKKFSDWGYKNLIVLPDNDIKPDKPNTGLIAAFKAVQGVPSASVQVPHLDGLKCDFNDIHKAKGIDEVRRQLHKDNALLFENGKLYVNKQKSKKAIERAEYQRKWLTFIDQVLPEQRESSREKQLNSLLENCPRHYSLETAIFKAESENLLPYEHDREKLRAEICQRYELKKQELKRRHGLTEADLIRCHRLDLANPNDVIKLHNVARYDKANIILHFGMGRGKTVLNNSIVIDDLDGLSTAIISPRKSLAHNINGLLSPTLGDKITHYQSEGRAKYTTQVLPVVVNSIVQFKLAKEFQHGIWDEIRITLESVLIGETMKKTQRAVDAGVNDFMAQNRLNVFSDADLNTLQFSHILETTPDKITYYVTDSRPREYELPPVKYIGGSLDTARHEILDRYNAGENVFCISDSMTEINMTAKFITEKEAQKADEAITETANYLKSHGVKQSEILVITRATNGNADVIAFLTNPNEESKKRRIVLASPTIQVGFNICNGHFDTAVGLMGSGACTSNEIVQSLYRVRDAKQIILAIKPQHNRARSISLEQFKDGHHNTQHRINDNDELETVTKLDALELRYYKMIVERHADLNDLENSILLHLENVGFTVLHEIPSETVTKSKVIKGLSAEVKADKAAQIKAARSILDAEFNELVKRQQGGLSTVENLEIERHLVEQMTGNDCFTLEQLTQLNILRANNLDPISDDDVVNFQNGMLKEVKARELKDADTAILKDNDDSQKLVGRLHKSETTQQFLIRELLASVKRHATTKTFKNKDGDIKAQSSEAFNKDIAEKICGEVLIPNAAELVQNGYADYEAKRIERPVQTLRNLFKQNGFKLNCLGRDGTNNRANWFEVIECPINEGYRLAREKNKLRKPTI
jgi:phage/plasmid primase-like uncharacterized protein